jgi:hypothetical protein
MKIDNLANQIAFDMDKALNSDENQKLFSKSSMIQKLAFHKVSDEDKLVSETEESLKAILQINKTAGSKCSGCECGEDKGSECKCHCHEDEPTKSASVESLVDDILKVSEALETAGFEKLAASSALLAGALVAEAKAKKDSKKDTKKSPKMGIKERMEKMRKMKGGKGKDSKKSTKPSSKASKPASKSSKPASKSSDSKK